MDNVNESYEKNRKSKIKNTVTIMQKDFNPKK